MFILQAHVPTIPFVKFSRHLSNHSVPFSTVAFSVKNRGRGSTLLLISKAEISNSQNLQAEVDEEYEGIEDETPSSSAGGFRERREEKDYDKDPEFAEILGNCLDDPQKAQSKAIRSWHIIGRLGGCNSMNMQLSQSPTDKKPTYDAISGANVTPTTFYNIGDLEVQDNLARIWVDIGTSEALLLDILINALTQISSDFVGIKQLVFGGSEFENWKENLTSEEAGCSIHRI